MKSKIANWLMFVLVVLVFSNALLGHAAIREEPSKLELSNAYAAGFCSAINGVFMLSKSRELDASLMVTYVKAYAQEIGITTLQMRDACKMSDAQFEKDYEMAVN